MGTKLGKTIAALRREKGMTQEQLADALGISTPAVSKWETDTSYPDITLLCPLARALGTNTDTLLHFEETLSEEQLTEQINEIIETARTKEVQAADEMLQELLHQYPSSIPLKYYASMVIDTFQMFGPLASAEQTEKWKKQKKQLLQAVCADRTTGYWQLTVTRLAFMLIEEGELDRAEHMLEELPEHTADPTLAWTQLYFNRGEEAKALEVIQKRLYVLVRQVQSCLIQLMSGRMEPDAAKALEICEIYQKVEEVFGCGGGMSDGFYIDLYRRAGREKNAIDSLVRFVDALTGPVKLPNPVLFSTMIKPGQEQNASTKEMRKMMLKALQTDESLAEYRGDPAFEAAIKKLSASLDLKKIENE